MSGGVPQCFCGFSIKVSHQRTQYIKVGIVMFFTRSNYVDVAKCVQIGQKIVETRSVYEAGPASKAAITVVTKIVGGFHSH